MRFFFSFILIAIFTINSHSAIKKEVVEYNHGEVTLKGYLVYDNLLKSKRPGLLLIHEWWGQNKYSVKNLCCLNFRENRFSKNFFDRK